MSEHYKKERVLGGDTTISSSSDQAIIANLKVLSLRTGGLPNPEIVIDGDQLPPKLVSLKSIAATTEETLGENAGESNRKLTHKDSGFAFSIYEERKTRRAA